VNPDMGLVQRVLGGFFAFLGALFGVITGLFGLGRTKDGFFLDLSPESDLPTNSVSPITLTPDVVPTPSPAIPTPRERKVEITPPPVPVVPQPPAIESFAPNYLISTDTISRRRPGPSMAGFKEMARQVRTPA